MKIINFFCFLLVSVNLISQGTTTEIELINDCNCEVLIFTEPILDPGLPPEIGPTTTDGHIEGDLNEFSKFINGQCYRTVHVQKRRIINNQIAYRTITMVDDINGLLQAFPNNSTFCFRGTFRFNNTITVERDKILKLLGNTSLKYTGDGQTPAISFEGSRSGIEGGTITTKVPMNEGLIRIISEGINDATDIHIRNIALVNTDNEIYAPNADARNDRAINMTNPFVSLVTQRDGATNYYAKITNVDITGFAVGMHLRGWSNAVSIRDIRFTDIHAYGLWISGCVDNSFANLSFTGCFNARAIRLDNYVDERFNGGNIGPIQLSLPDPNERMEFATNELLEPLIDPFGTQVLFNQSIADLHNINEDNDPTYYLGIYEACGSNPNYWVTEIAFENLFENPSGDVSKLGLFDLALDDDGTVPGYLADGLDIRSTDPNLNRLTDENEPVNANNEPLDRISLYKATFDHNITMLPVTTLTEPTCNELAGTSMFFRRPSFNAFSEISYVISGISQVANLVEVNGREDDIDLCMDKISELDCENCFYDETDNEGNVDPGRRASGFGNTINVCEEPDDPNFIHLINNTATTDPPRPECDLDLVVSFFGL